MITYIIHSSVIWGSFLGLYYLIFRRHTFFKVNRAYLILSLLAGLIIPLLEIPQFLPQEDIFTFTLEPIVITGQEEGLINSVLQGQSALQGLESLLVTIWLIIALIKTWHLISGLAKIHRLIATNVIQKAHGFTKVSLDGDLAPFSFLHFIFLKENNDVNQLDSTIRHELVHVQQKHTLDILLVEIIKIVFWFNPLIYLFKNALAENHEFLADESASKKSKRTYCQLLVQTADLQIHGSAVNSFIQSSIQNRIKMMYKNRSKPFFRVIYLLALPLVFALALLGFNSRASDMVKLPVNSVFIDPQDTLPVPPPPPPPPPKHKKSVSPPPPPPPPPSVPKENEEVFEVVDEMPLFPGSGDFPGAAEKKQEYSLQKLMGFVGTHLKYPEEARKKGIQGTVIAQFVVKKDGSIGKLKIIRDIGEGCGDAVMAVLKTMQELPEKWTPGKQNGQAVHVMYTLPVKFALDDKPKSSK